MKNKVEAILYTLGKFISAEELAKLLDTTPNKITQELKKLQQEYKKRNTSLTIQILENKYKLNIKKEHAHLTNKLLSDTEMDTPTTNTLAIVAYKAPVTQSEVIKLRGNKAYEHIKQLKESKLISAEKQGRTRLLKLTSHFYDYFDIQEKELKEKLNTLKSQNKSDIESLKKMFIGFK